MGVGVSFEKYQKIERKGTPTSVHFECTKITEYNIGVNETREVRFKVGGKNDDEKRSIKFDFSNSNISLSTSSWKAENEWILRTKITGKKNGTTVITVKVEDKTLNSITIHCVDYKDVFSEENVKRLIAENKISIADHTACIVAADKQLGKLLDNTSDFITNSSNNNADVYTAYKRVEQIKKKGFLANEKKFSQYVFKGGGNYQPKEYSEENKHAVSDYLKASINGKLGYHVFYFTILNGYHVLTLVINNQNPCDVKFKIYDQLRDRGEYVSLLEVDNKLLEMNTNNWSGAASLTRDKTASTKFGIWKIQRK
ncbi:hypothetical protein [Chryseobacterium sp.]|uniref:hypothetical protein n=1 Tax=Chryseobacterium sp. TaxID=1871047 RepID=UPI0025C2C209|nr:hypothetical protein [Chryseobacterium sp.]MBV8325897.1 hypothetical protein [Chryseobacterium sp.]